MLQKAPPYWPLAQPPAGFWDSLRDIQKPKGITPLYKKPHFDAAAAIPGFWLVTEPKTPTSTHTTRSSSSSGIPEHIGI